MRSLLGDEVRVDAAILEQPHVEIPCGDIHLRWQRSAPRPHQPTWSSIWRHWSSSRWMSCLSEPYRGPVHAPGVTPSTATGRNRQDPNSFSPRLNKLSPRKHLQSDGEHMAVEDLGRWMSAWFTRALAFKKPRPTPGTSSPCPR